jgi:hypothetical protein
MGIRQSTGKNKKSKRASSATRLYGGAHGQGGAAAGVRPRERERGNMTATGSGRPVRGRRPRNISIHTARPRNPEERRHSWKTLD